MSKYYYILTSKKGMFNYTNKSEALADYRRMATYCENLRLERANFQDGTARVIKSKNNIW